MNDYNQNIKGLEAAYKEVFGRELKGRIIELCDNYGLGIDKLCTELNPDGVVPCEWSLYDLAQHYQLSIPVKGASVKAYTSINN